MRFKITISLFLFTFFFMDCNQISKEKQDEALVFNQKIVGYSQPVIDKVNSLLSLIKEHLQKSIQGRFKPEDITEFSNSFESLISLIDRNVDSLKALNEFDPKIPFRQSGIDYLASLKSLLMIQFRELYDLVQKEITRESGIKSAELLLEILEKLLSVEKSTKQVQKDFADKYSLPLEKDPQNREALERQYNACKKQVEQMKGK